MAQFGHLSRYCLEGLEKNHENLMIAGVQPLPSLVFVQSTHDAKAVTTVNKGPKQRKHTNWTG